MFKDKTRSLIWGVLFIVWTSLIILFSVLPGDGMMKLGKEDSGFRWDYLEHLSVFIMFSILYLQWRKNDPVKMRLAGLAITGLFFAAGTEAFQLFIQSRSFNYIDLLLNIAGLPTGLVFTALLQKILPSSPT